MSLFGHTNASQAPTALGVRVQTSLQGTCVPVVFGRVRLAGNIIWVNDFSSQQQSQGGKGGLFNQGSAETIYSSSYMLGLCEGEIASIGVVWQDTSILADDSQFTFGGTSGAYGSYTQSPWSYLTSNHSDQALSYKGMMWVAQANYNMGTSPALPNWTFEVQSTISIGLTSSGSTIPDADPSVIFSDILTNSGYGVGFPSAKIGSLTQWSNYIKAYGIWLSPLYNSQTSVRDYLQQLLTLTNSNAFFSEGIIKVVPYGDTAQTSITTGVTFTPNVTPVYSLGDDDFIINGQEPPVKCTRTSQKDIYNSIMIEYTDRSNSYNVSTLYVSDQASIDTYGLRGSQSVSAHEICTQQIAQQVAQLLLQRQVYIRRQFNFTLGPQYCLLEPMDIVDLTDANLGLSAWPVRILSIAENGDNFDCTAEDFPAGVGHAALFTPQPNEGYAVNYNIAATPCLTPVIFIPPAPLTSTGYEVWIGTAGAPTTWGGAQVYLSFDGSTYQYMGEITAPSRMGILTSALSSHADPDSSDSFAVNFSESYAQFDTASSTDADNFATLAYLTGGSPFTIDTSGTSIDTTSIHVDEVSGASGTPEIIAYSANSLTSAYNYSFGTYIRRGIYSTPSSHPVGTTFLRLDTNTLFKYPYNPAALAGKTIYVKLCSFNPWGGGVEDISSVTAQAFTIPSTYTPPAPTVLVAAEGVGFNVITATIPDWTDVDLVNFYGSTSNTFSSATLLGSVKGNTFNHFGTVGDLYYYWAVAQNGLTPQGTPNVSTEYPGATSTISATVSAASSGPAGASVSVEYSADSVTWHNPPFVSGTDIYMRVQVGSAGWSAAMQIVGESGAAGAAGGYVQFIFTQSATQPSTPSSSSSSIPTGWSTTPPSVPGSLVWMSEAEYTGAGVIASTWSTPIQIQGSRQGNLLSMYPWVVGSTSTQGNYVPNGPEGVACSDSIILGAGPYSVTQPLWKMVPLETLPTYNVCAGGFNNSNDLTGIDPTRTYRAAIWFKFDAAGSNVYFGCAPNGVTAIGGGAALTNPYFVTEVPFSSLTAGRWYLLIGVIHAAGYSGADSGLSGIYDPTTGSRVAAGTDFVQESSVTTQEIRAYSFSATSTAAVSYFTDPRWEVMDSNAPSIATLLSPSGILAYLSSVQTANIALNGATIVASSAHNVNLATPNSYLTQYSSSNPPNVGTTGSGISSYIDGAYIGAVPVACTVSVTCTCTYATPASVMASGYYGFIALVVSIGSAGAAQNIQVNGAVTADNTIVFKYTGSANAGDSVSAGIYAVSPYSTSPPSIDVYNSTMLLEAILR